MTNDFQAAVQHGTTVTQKPSMCVAVPCLLTAAVLEQEAADCLAFQANASSSDYL